VVITTLAHERAGTAPHVRLQKEQRALVDLARRTELRGRLAHRDPIVRQRVAQHAIEVQITRFLGYRNVTSIERTGKPGPEGSILKLFWSEAEQRMMESAADLLGPRGLLLEGEPRAADAGTWARELLWTRAASIYAGTSEVQRNIIAQRVLGLPRG
jgi:alkylation response protein AidB-like acyl-CoA dehydrogenase